MAGPIIPCVARACTLSDPPLWACCVQAHSVCSCGLCLMDCDVRQLWIHGSARGDTALGGGVYLVSGEDLVEGAGEENGRRSRSSFSQDDVGFNQY